VNPSSPWVRFLVAVVGTALAIRIALDLIAPVFSYLLAVIALVGVVLVVRWWRNNRW
jgi:hypothetical protein